MIFSRGNMDLLLKRYIILIKATEAMGLIMMKILTFQNLIRKQKIFYKSVTKWKTECVKLVIFLVLSCKI